MRGPEHFATPGREDNILSRAALLVGTIMGVVLASPGRWHSWIDEASHLSQPIGAPLFVPTVSIPVAEDGSEGPGRPASGARRLSYLLL